MTTSNYSDQPMVSIVIPVYNVADYLRGSLDTIVNQTYANLQIICVNDGATDASPDILKEYEQKDDRITVIHQVNMGLSCARNSGAKQASGKYMYFMDSDDYLESDAIEKLVAFAEENQLQIVAFDADAFTDEPQMNTLKLKYDVWYHRDDVYPSVCKGSELFRQLVERDQLIAPVWTSFILRSYFEECGLWYHPGILMEDFPYTVPAYLSAERMGYLHESFFHRRVRSASIMTSKITFPRPYGYFAGVLDVINYVEAKQLVLTDAEWDALNRILKKRIRIAGDNFRGLDPEEKKKADELPTRERLLFHLLVEQKAKEEVSRKQKIIRYLKKYMPFKRKKEVPVPQKSKKAPVLLNEQNARKLRQLQETLDEIIAEIDRICRANNIPYFMYGGTLLGAARDGKFIPWDDDADLAMMYDDVLRFAEACKTQLDEKYFCQTCFTDSGYPTMILKIRKNGTYFRETKYDGKDFHQGVFVDVLPLTYFPDNKILGDIALHWMSLLHQVCCLRRCHSKHLSAKILFKLFRLLPVKFWIRVRKATLEFCNKHSGHTNVCSFASHYKPLRKRVLKKEWFADTVEMEFDGMKLLAPAGGEGYLKHLYGEDYMTPLPASERYIHSDLDSLRL